MRLFFAMPRQSRRRFVRYAILFCVPLLAMGMLLMYSNIDYINKESESRAYTSVGQLVSRFDHMMQQMQNAVLYMSSDPLWSGGESGAQDAEIISGMNRYMDQFSYDLVMAYYSRGHAQVYMDGQSISYRQFENQSGKLALSLSGFYTNLNTIKASQAMAIRSANGADALYVTACLFPVPVLSATPSGTIIFLVKEDLMHSTLHDFIDVPNAQLYIYDLSHTTIYSSPGGDDERAQALLKAPSGVSQCRINGASLCVMRTVSSQSGYTYILTLPKADLYADSQNLARVFSLLMAAMVLFSVLMTFFYTRSDIMRIQMAEERQREMSDTLDSQAGIIRELVLKKLMSGHTHNAREVHHDISCANLQFPYPHFTVLIARCPGKIEIPGDALPVFEPHGTEKIIGYSVWEPERNQISLVLNFDAPETLARAGCDYAQKVHALLPDADIGWGSVFDSLERIGDAYIQAVVAVGEKLGSTAPHTYTFENVRLGGEAFQYPYIEQAIILESLRSGNRDAALAALNRIFENVLLAASHPMQRLLCYETVNMLAKISNTLGFPLSTQTICAMSCFQSLEDLRRQAVTVLEELSRESREQAANQLISNKYRIIEFIQREQRNYNLSLGMIADEFGFSQTYVGKLVKEETGQPFSQYITQLRMQSIKRQLEEEDTQIKDIILGNGYLDVASFTRKFRLLEGVTPGQYRALKRQGMMRGMT